MKPYLRVLFNAIRLGSIKIRCKNLSFMNPTLFGWNTKFVFSPTSKIRFHSHICSDGRLTIITDCNSNLEIGDGVYFNEGTMISCKSSIFIGNHCLFGPGVKIFDNNHVFTLEEGVTTSHNSKPVKIGSNCWIASNVVITSGSEIGNNCVIGANCVVSGTVPDGMIVKQSGHLSIEPIREKS